MRKAICKDLSTRKQTTYTPEQIVVANGAKQAVIQALLCIVKPGDEVILPKPYWPSYPDMVKLCYSKPVYTPSTAADSYLLSPTVLRSTLESNPNVKCIILCNPSNPTGAVYNKEQLQGLAKVLLDFPSVIVIADEIYERLTYDVPHVSFASIDGMYDRTVVINGFSKSHSMTGYRIGYSASPVDIAKAIGKLQSQLTSCASSIGQEAARVALTTVDDKWMSERVHELQKKRDLAYNLLKEIPHVTCPKPNGAFYLLPDISHYYNKKTASGMYYVCISLLTHSFTLVGTLVKDSHTLCLELLRNEQVALVSGDAFGADECLRISYAASEELITTSIRRLKSFLLSLK